MEDEQNFEAGVHRDYCFGENGRIHFEAQGHPAHLFWVAYTKFHGIAWREGGFWSNGKAEPRTGFSSEAAGKFWPGIRCEDDKGEVVGAAGPQLRDAVVGGGALPGGREDKK